MDRYQVAPPSVAAVIHAAMDARRADHDPDIPAALLAKAAPAYMTSAQLAMASDHWWEEALDYAVQPCNGIPGLLVPAYRLTRSAANKRPPAAGRPAYRLADCLDQYGRIRRADCLPPHGFWEAMAAHARLDRPSAAPDLLHALRRFAPDQAEVLLSRDPTADVDLTREFPGSLMRKLRRARKDDQVRALAQRLIDYPLLKLEELEDAAMNLLHELHQEAQVVAWCDFHIETDGELDPDWAALWMFQLQRIGASKHADAVAGRIVSHGRLHDPFEVAKILWNLQWYELLRRKGHRPGEGMAVQLLVQLTEEAKYSTNEMVKAVLDRDPASQVDLINPLGPGPWTLPRIRRYLGWPQVSPRTLYRRVRLVAIWRRPKLTARGDPDHDHVVAGIVARLMELPRRSVVLAEDETHLNLLPHVRASWTLRGARPQVLTPGTNRKVTVLGALEVSTGRWVYRLGRRRAADFIALLDQVLQAFPLAPAIAMICDNDSIHHARKVTTYLEEHPRLKMLYGARYSPQDNPAERIWAALKNYVANTAVSWPGRLRQIHSFFRSRSPDQMLATAAPWTSPWLPPGYEQNLWNGA